MPRWFTCPQTVTLPSTKWALRKVTNVKNVVKIFLCNCNVSAFLCVLLWQPLAQSCASCLFCRVLRQNALSVLYVDNDDGIKSGQCMCKFSIGFKICNIYLTTRSFCIGYSERLPTARTANNRSPPATW